MQVCIYSWTRGELTKLATINAQNFTSCLSTSQPMFPSDTQRKNTLHETGDYLSNQFMTSRKRQSWRV